MNGTWMAAQMFPGSRSRSLFGVVVGLVTNNEDPDGLARVKVKFPWLNDDDESYWARVVSPMGGNGRGAYFLPEVDDEVLVAFEHGSSEHAYVIGSLWNGKDKPPESNADGKNNVRALKSRSGHLIRLDDSDGAEKLEIIDKTGDNKISFDSASKNIAIEASGDITIQAKGSLKLTASSVEVTSQGSLKIQCAGSGSLEASGSLAVKGSVVNIN